MSVFSLYNYMALPDHLKEDFNSDLGKRLSLSIEDIKNDDNIGMSAIVNFISSQGHGSNFSSVVTELYSKISSGIQAGSGNQSLYLSLLSEYVECWKHIEKEE